MERRRLLLFGLAAAFSSPALGHLLPPSIRRRGDPIGTLKWVDSWPCYVIARGGYFISRGQEYWMPPALADLPVHTTGTGLLIGFFDQHGQRRQFSVDAEPHYYTAALRRLYRTLSRAGVRCIEPWPLEPEWCCFFPPYDSDPKPGDDPRP